MSNKFQPGDLVILNQYGLFITVDHENKVGIVISKAYNILPYDLEANSDTFYIVHDVLLEGELIKMIPAEFMESYGPYEEDIK